MSWIVIAIIAYFLLALVNIGDKLFLGGFVKSYRVYAALVGVLGMVVIFLAPWFLEWPGAFVFWVSIVSGVFFILALLSFFRALKVGEASRVIPFIGGLVPVFTFALSAVFLSEVLTGQELFAFVFLLVGTVLVVRIPEHLHWWEVFWSKVRKKRRFSSIFVATFAAFFFAFSYVLSKYVYESTPFLNGFIWIRVGSFMMALLLLIRGETRKVFFQTIRNLVSKTGSLFVGNQLLGAGGFFLQSVAISLGSVTLVNALQGVQYVFVIFLAALASLKFPKLAGEGDIDLGVILEKITAVALIGVGLALLASGG